MHATLLVTRCPITPISISSLPTRLSFAATLALSDPSQPPKLRPRSISTFPRRLFATPYRIRVDEAHEDTTEFGYKFRHSMDGERAALRLHKREIRIQRPVHRADSERIVDQATITIYTIPITQLYGQIILYYGRLFTIMFT